MKKITDDHLGELKTFQDRVVRKLEGKIVKDEIK